VNTTGVENLKRKRKRMDTRARIRKILDEIPKEFIDAMTYYSTVCFDPACTWRKCLEMKMAWEEKTKTPPD